MMSRPSAKPAGPNLSIFRTPPVSRGLADEFAARLAADINDGRLTPGTRLPTEQQMIAATGVSRTVVREAVAALRAEGLVITRQGVGAFVADRQRGPFRIKHNELGSLHDVLQVMELRTGIEIEAAGLAAERASPPAVKAIAEAYQAIERAILRDESGVDQDFAFHCSIARATGNAQFLHFLDYLGRFIIPRQTISSASGTGGSRRVYLERIQREHRTIMEAIRATAVAPARAAMRRHLHNSVKRYSQLAEKAEAE